MLRACLVSAAMIAVMAVLGPAADASDTCQRSTGRKCSVGQSAPPKPKGPVIHKATQPPIRGNHKGREEYTPAQRERFMEEARALCRKTYGAPSRVYRVDYKRNTVTCESPSY